MFDDACETLAACDLMSEQGLLMYGTRQMLLI